MTRDPAFPVNRAEKSLGRSYTQDKDDVEALCNIDEGLSTWETQFVESIAMQVLDRGNTLSPKQREVVDRILERRGLA